MIRFCQVIWLVVAILFVSGTAIAGPDLVDHDAAIPFKSSPTPLEEHGTRVILGILVFIGISGFLIYFLRKKNPDLSSIAGNGKRIRIIERKRLNTRCSLYIIQFDQHELLISQSGDNIVCLSDSLAIKKEKK